MSNNSTIYSIARIKCAYDAQIFKHLYDLDIKELIGTLSSSGFNVKPVHILKSELIKPLTQDILTQAKKAKNVTQRQSDSEISDQLSEFSRHIKAVALRFRKLEREKNNIAKNDFRRYLRSLKSELSDIACLPVKMSEKRYKYFAREIFKIDYFITNELLKLNCESVQKEPVNER